MTAYSLFFRDAQSTIKAQNQQATFGEVSRIVATMWDSLEQDEKEVRCPCSDTGCSTACYKLLCYYHYLSGFQAGCCCFLSCQVYVSAGREYFVLCTNHDWLLKD